MARPLKDIVSARLDEISRNPFEAARIAGLERSFINDILIDRKKSVRGNNLVKLAKALDLTPEEIIAQMQDKDGFANKEFVRPISVPVRGETAAGRWFEHDDMIDEQPELIPAIPGRYSGLEQFAFRVFGPSMNMKRIHHGDYVVCVPYFDARMKPESGDIVVVERRRGQLIERTCKELQVSAAGFELWPRSADPKFQEPIRVADCNSTADDGTEIEIIGLVIAIHVPV